MRANARPRRSGSKGAGRPAALAADGDDRAAADSPGGLSTYLYGIVRWPLPAGLKSLGTGVGDPPGAVRAVRSGNVAALVSDVAAAEMATQGVRGLRRDMKAHSALLNALAARVTLLPARFGVVLPNGNVLRAELLEPQSRGLETYLDQLEGTVEVTLRATYVEEQALREIVAARPELGGAARQSGGGRTASMASESRIELGRQVAAAIQDAQDRDARWLLDVLSPVVRDVRIGKPMTDLMVLNASLLVDRTKLPKFDRLLDNVNEEVGHRMTFDCVGPLPPFSFVDLRL